MSRSLRLTAVTALWLLLSISAALAAETATVIRVIDGDTLRVQLADAVETVRLIGVDTPESVHPQKAVEHFGEEASAFTKQLVEGTDVRLEEDPDTANRDRYGRLLNAEIIAQGYGFAYTKYPFSKLE